MTDRLDERRIALAIVGASVALFLALFAIQGPAFQTPDDAKYVGLGLNILDGKGLVTDFGAPILYHAPVWPLVLAVPKAWLGLDPFALGHVIEAIAAALSMLFAAALAWRYRPAAGAVTAAALLATPYLANLARSAGIDLPATAFVLAYLWVAVVAIERGSARLGLLAGLLFGAGFLIKETVIPFAPVPFLAALLGMVPARTIGRVSAAALLAATVTSAWWFVLYAQLTGQVYRVGGPAWLLVPIGLAVVVVVIVGLALPRLSRSALGQALDARLSGRRSRVLRAVVAWGGLGVWLLGQLAIYAVAPKLSGASIVRLSQLVADVSRYLPQIGMIVAIGVVGALLALRAARSQPVWQLLFAGVAQVALIVLVLGIGETPRHYLATLCLGAALGGVGFVAVARRAFAGSDRWLLLGAVGIVVLAGGAQLLHSRHVSLNAPRALAAGVALLIAFGLLRWTWLRFERRLTAVRPRLAGTLVLTAVFLSSAAIATATAARGSAGEASIANRNRALAEIGAWLRATVPPGQTVSIGPALAYELALEVHGSLRVVRALPERAIADPSTPTGLRLSKSAGVAPLTLETALRKVDSLDTYSSEHLLKQLRVAGAVLWIEAGYLAPDVESTPLTEALKNAAGARLAMRWSYPLKAGELVVSAFWLDLAGLEFMPDVTYAQPEAVDVLARMLAEDGSRDAATAFLDRLIVVPPGDAADAALARLRSVAAP